MAAKWVIKALTPGDSNLKILLPYRILKIQPWTGGKWPVNVQWILTPVGLVYGTLLCRLGGS
jgi:hypothetical protein